MPGPLIRSPLLSHLQEKHSLESMSTQIECTLTNARDQQVEEFSCTKEDRWLDQPPTAASLDMHMSTQPVSQLEPIQ
jgi:hypothetical protein